MPKIECTWGPAETPVAGFTYLFEKDDKGRHVATVHNEDHVAILLSVAHYRVLEDDTPAKAEKARPAKPEPTVAEPAPEQPEPATADTDRETQTITAADVSTLDGLGIVEGETGSTEGQTDEPQPDPAPAAPPLENDDVTRINGIGDQLKSRLHEDAGITSIRQIAELTEEQITVLNDKLKLHGRITRDSWVEKAREIIAGA